MNKLKKDILCLLSCEMTNQCYRDTFINSMYDVIDHALMTQNGSKNNSCKQKYITMLYEPVRWAL